MFIYIYIYKGFRYIYIRGKPGELHGWRTVWMKQGCEHLQGVAPWANPWGLPGCVQRVLVKLLC